jgi:hypothetical protein
MGFARIPFPRPGSLSSAQGLWSAHVWSYVPSGELLSFTASRIWLAGGHLAWYDEPRKYAM